MKPTSLMRFRSKLNYLIQSTKSSVDIKHQARETRAFLTSTILIITRSLIRSIIPKPFPRAWLPLNRRLRHAYFSYFNLLE